MIFPFASLASSLIPTSIMHTNFRIKVKKRKEKKKQALNCYQYPASFFPRSSFSDCSKTEVGRRTPPTSHPTLPTPSSSTAQPKPRNETNTNFALSTYFGHTDSHISPRSRYPPKVSQERHKPQGQKWGEKQKASISQRAADVTSHASIPPPCPCPCTQPSTGTLMHRTGCPA